MPDEDETKLKTVNGVPYARGDGRLAGMTFSEALDHVKHGARNARAGWNGKGMFVFLVPGSQFQVNREPLLSLLGKGTTVDYRPHLDMKAADGTIGVWLASQADILAGDWYLAEPAPQAENQTPPKPEEATPGAAA